MPSTINIGPIIIPLDMRRQTGVLTSEVIASSRVVMRSHKNSGEHSDTTPPLLSRPHFEG